MNKSFRRKGLTLPEVADLLIYLGAQYAINMDGGSSSVLVHQSNVLNHPMCYYNAIIPRKWYPCERSVATVICISS
jgi:exopolysaccharide biosynthesis protein